MTRRHGVISTTYQNLVIDSGAVYTGYTAPASLGTLLGATRGGNTFTIETEYKEMEVDGAHGPVKSGRRITQVVAKLTCNFLAIDRDIILLNLPGSAAADEGVTHKTFSRSLAIADADYETSIVLVGEVAGSSNPIICGLNNAMCVGNMEIAMADKDESVLAVEFTGHFAADALDTEPWILLFPYDVSTPTPAP